MLSRDHHRVGRVLSLPILQPFECDGAHVAELSGETR